MSTTDRNNQPNTTPDLPKHALTEGYDTDTTPNPFKTIYARDLDKPAAL